MSAAPPLDIELVHSGAWRIAVGLTAFVGMLAIVGWAVASQASAPGLRFGLAATASVVALWVGLSVVRQPAARLAWDGRCWHLCEGASEAGDATAGALSVAIDLGPWMLLRFDRATAPPWSRVRWIPVQRRGLEPNWHGLRCAVYSPRPEIPSDASAASPPTA